MLRLKNCKQYRSNLFHRSKTHYQIRHYGPQSDIQVSEQATWSRIAFHAFSGMHSAFRTVVFHVHMKAFQICLLFKKLFSVTQNSVFVWTGEKKKNPRFSKNNLYVWAGPRTPCVVNMAVFILIVLQTCQL